MVSLWGRPWTRSELLARVGRLDQVAGVQLVEAGDGAAVVNRSAGLGVYQRYQRAVLPTTSPGDAGRLAGHPARPLMEGAR